jgi:hypothetical protein
MGGCSGSRRLKSRNHGRIVGEACLQIVYMSFWTLSGFCCRDDLEQIFKFFVLGCNTCVLAVSAYL